MSNLIKYTVGFLVIFSAFAFAGSMDYRHEVEHEQVAKTYYNELAQRYGRRYAMGEINE